MNSIPVCLGNECSCSPSMSCYWIYVRCIHFLLACPAIESLWDAFICADLILADFGWLSFSRSNLLCLPMCLGVNYVNLIILQRITLRFSGLRRELFFRKLECLMILSLMQGDVLRWVFPTLHCRWTFFLFFFLIWEKLSYADFIFYFYCIVFPGHYKAFVSTESRRDIYKGEFYSV